MTFCDSHFSDLENKIIKFHDLAGFLRALHPYHRVMGRTTNMLVWDQSVCNSIIIGGCNSGSNLLVVSVGDVQSSLCT